MSDQHADSDARFAKAVAKGALIGLPVAIVAVFFFVMFVFEQSAADAFSTSILPATLIGVFFGGFVGMVTTMDH